MGHLLPPTLSDAGIRSQVRKEGGRGVDSRLSMTRSIERNDFREMKRQPADERDRRTLMSGHARANCDTTCKKRIEGRREGGRRKLSPSGNRIIDIKDGSALRRICDAFCFPLNNLTLRARVGRPHP